MMQPIYFCFCAIGYCHARTNSAGPDQTACLANLQRRSRYIYFLMDPDDKRESLEVILSQIWENIMWYLSILL